MSGRSSEEKGKKQGSKRQRAQYVFDDEDGVAHLVALIIGHSLEGGAVRVGLTRDEGALAIGLYHGENYGTEYVRPTEELAQAIREISLDWGITLAVFDGEGDLYKLP